MSMCDRFVCVGMNVGLMPIPHEIVGMLVMFVVIMSVRVLQGLMGMNVPMSLGEVQANSQYHQRACRDKLPGDGLALQEQR